jgi:hypothetical protein
MKKIICSSFLRALRGENILLISENPIFIESYKSVILGIFFEDLSYEQDYCKEFSSLIKGT